MSLKEAIERCFAIQEYIVNYSFPLYNLVSTLGMVHIWQWADRLLFQGTPQNLEVVQTYPIYCFYHMIFPEYY
jgi:hypothetical protein